MPRPVVFLDRDGTINEEVHHLHNVEQFRLYDGVGRGVRLLNEAGFKVVVVTNQSVVARGMLDEAGLAQIHQEMRQQLARDGARVDAIYVCPHHPTEGNAPYRRVCNCRKPAPGMLLSAQADLDLDLEDCFLVGDKDSDLAAGRAAGCRSILVLTGYGSETLAGVAAGDPAADHVSPNLLEAAQWILDQAG